MPNLLEYFNNDFKDLSFERNVTITIQNPIKAINEVIEIKESIKQQIDSDVRMITYYIPLNSDILGIIRTLLNHVEERISSSLELIAITGFTQDKILGNHKLIFANRIYIYSENLLTENETIELDEYCKQKGYYVIVRSSDYVETKMKLEKPLAFISHDSRDKDLIARKLAMGLNSRLCPVWYDEYTLKIGDSLRESIETGIKEAKKCILILTKNFLNNPGWGKKEFNSIFTREMIMNERIVLPIWFEVTKEEVYNYSPSLVDTFALIWPSSENKTDEEYKKEIEILISKVHTSIMN